MKIIIFSHLFPNEQNKYYGLFNLSRAKALQDNGHSVLVIAPISLGFPLRYIFPRRQFSTILSELNKKRKIPQHETRDGIQVVRPRWLGLPRKWFWQHRDYELKIFAGRKIKKTVLLFQPDLILAPYIHPYGSYLRFIKKYWNFKAFVIADGSDFLISPKIYSGWKRVERKLNKSCDAIFCVSNKMEEYARKETKLNNIRQLNNGFSPKLFMFDSRIIKDEKVFKLISVGNLQVVKGHDILLNAMLHLNGNIHLSIVGDGPERLLLERFIKNNNLSSKVTLLGRLSLSEMLVHLQQSHLFCMPSRSEGFGIAPIEAMSVGLPVVASNVGAMSDYVIAGFNGYNFQSEDVDDLVSKINKARKTSWQPKEISVYVNNEFTWDVWAKKIEKEYMGYKNQPEL
ncbi:MAG: glycosyltransferase [Bacteroidetes bacterium]|jgi:glycosyltransferase involved in cell wall biosynthesis|nr:glycosyltransferase [Bacteroidota bacterium]